jgi:hypothetical protein
MHDNAALALQGGAMSGTGLGLAEGQALVAIVGWAAAPLDWTAGVDGWVIDIAMQCKQLASGSQTQTSQLTADQ